MHPTTSCVFVGGERELVYACGGLSMPLENAQSCNVCPHNLRTCTTNECLHSSGISRRYELKNPASYFRRSAVSTPPGSSSSSPLDCAHTGYEPKAHKPDSFSVRFIPLQHPCYRDITVHGRFKDLMADEEGQASPGMTTSERGRQGLDLRAGRKTSPQGCSQ